MQDATQFCEIVTEGYFPENSRRLPVYTTGQRLVAQMTAGNSVETTSLYE